MGTSLTAFPVVLWALVGGVKAGGPVLSPRRLPSPGPSPL